MHAIKRLVYVGIVRLPTEKAHGYQICKMCEAFAKANVEVLLLHPFRHQSDRKLKGQSLFDYYSLPHYLASICPVPCQGGPSDCPQLLVGGCYDDYHWERGT